MTTNVDGLVDRRPVYDLLSVVVLFVPYFDSWNYRREVLNDKLPTRQLLLDSLEANIVQFLFDPHV